MGRRELRLKNQARSSRDVIIPQPLGSGRTAAGLPFQIALAGRVHTCGTRPGLFSRLAGQHLGSRTLPCASPPWSHPGASGPAVALSGADLKSRPAQSLEEPGNHTKHTQGLPGSGGRVLTSPAPKCCHSWAKWIRIQAPAAGREATETEQQWIGVGGGSRGSERSAWGDWWGFGAVRQSRRTFRWWCGQPKLQLGGSSIKDSMGL